MKTPQVSVSILNADFGYLANKIKECQKAGAEMLHFDVMDGHFVDNISFGIPVLESITKYHNMINDVHIMISNPLHFAPKFCDAGADIVTFHYEACKNDFEVQEVIESIHAKGKKAGLSVKPGTDYKVLDKFLKDLDLILLMSVEPGFGGQKFIPATLEKIAYFRNLIDTNGYHTLIEVDGGVNKDTAKLCVEAGIDVLVVGSFIFKGATIKDNVAAVKGK